MSPVGVRSLREMVGLQNTRKIGEKHGNGNQVPVRGRNSRTLKP
jgi:hypothetical protein